MGNKPTVHVVTLTRGMMRAELGQFREWLLLQEVLKEKRYHLLLGLSDAQPVANNRNRTALRILENEAVGYLCSIDNDSVPAGFNPLDYVERDLDVVGFPYLTWRANADPPLVWIPEDPAGRELEEVKVVGGGCLLIARRVLEHPDMRAPFLDCWDADGRRTKPEDYNFSWRARRAGFRVWCAFDKPLHHFKNVELLTLWRWINKKGRWSEEDNDD